MTQSFVNELQAIADRPPRAFMLTSSTRVESSDVEDFASPEGIGALKERLRAAMRREERCCKVRLLKPERDYEPAFETLFNSMQIGEALFHIQGPGLMALTCLRELGVRVSIHREEYIRQVEDGSHEKGARYYLCAELPRANGHARTLGQVRQSAMSYSR